MPPFLVYWLVYAAKITRCRTRTHSTRAMVATGMPPPAVAIPVGSAPDGARTSPNKCIHIFQMVRTTVERAVSRCSLLCAPGCDRQSIRGDPWRGRMGDPRREGAHAKRAHQPQDVEMAGGAPGP